MKKRILLKKIIAPVAIVLAGPFLVNDLARNPVNAFNKFSGSGKIVEDNLEEMVELPEVVELARIPETVEIPEVVYDDYKENPGGYDENEPDAVTLARLIYAETRSEWRSPEVLFHKGSSVLNRVKDRGKSVNGAIFEKRQYKALIDHNRAFFDNPSNFMGRSADKNSWEAIYEVAQDLIENGPMYETDYTIHQKHGENDPSVEYGWIRDGLKNGQIEKIGKLKTTTGFYHYYKDI